jgi:cell division protein ZapA
MSQEAVNAHIMGQSYVLSAPSAEAADLRAAVARVDAAMCRIRDAGKIKARERIAVLAALNIAFDAEQAQHSAALAQQALPAPEAQASVSVSVSTLPPDLQANDSRLATLLYKLDQALGRDGHLL